jgi:hypothetical protein
MKTILIAISLVILFSCKKEASTANTSTITVTLDNCSSEETGVQDFQICFDSLLEDSRCPSNAVCIWQGVAKAKFRFNVNNQEHIVHLSTLDIAPYYNNDTAVGNAHLKLIDIAPHPVLGNNPQGPITATVEVTQ